MKVLSDITPIDFGASPANQIELPQGIIGFSAYKRAELLYMPDHLPFLWLRLHGPDTIHFVVMEPGGIIADYEPEIFDEDAEQLGIGDPAHAMVLNIVTLRQQQPVEATVNLVGPIIVNRRTRIGRQLVISNYSRYSAHYALVDNSPAQACARIA
ncbi:MAG: flagellar assembly protein FliW [Opitutus sp.]|nr:flagellar assembly protein FliW [Opitutus sp.]